jgi:hypothetical protein
MQNPVIALSSAQQLLAMKECTGAQRYIGHCYCAEALCCLSRPQEALEHLAPNGVMISGDMAVAAAVAAVPDRVQANSVPGGQSQQQVSANARCSLHINLANVYILQVRPAIHSSHMTRVLRFIRHI